MASVTDSTIWKTLQAAARSARSLDLRDRLDNDPRRCRHMQCDIPGLALDYSRNLIECETLPDLFALADEARVMDAARRMVRGEPVNATEDRAALHVASRDLDSDLDPAPPAAVLGAARSEREHMFDFAERVRGGMVRSPDGGRYTDIVSIGIGGSHLGPEMALAALTASASAPRVHFIANVDPAHSARVLAGLDPARTLVVLISKTFTTQETLANARAVQAWMLAGGLDAPVRQFVAVTANREAAAAYGIEVEQIFGFGDWVGGRYSLWSSVGLPLAIAVGSERFRELLKGAHAMDRHFLEAEPAGNMPLILGLLDVWYADLIGAATHAVVPYSDRLRLLPAYLQQLMMESNGKSVRLDGAPVDAATSPVVWGGVGTDGQHAFFQLLHQGTARVPVDFIVALESGADDRERQDMLVANAFAQAEALARGRDLEQTETLLALAGKTPDEIRALAPHQSFPGNRPSNMLMLDRLDAYSLGMLVALFEHRVFVQAAIWGINPFDQMGVELGKRMAGDILTAFDDPAEHSDPVTRALIERYRRFRP